MWVVMGAQEDRPRSTCVFVLQLHPTCVFRSRCFFFICVFCSPCSDMFSLEQVLTPVVMVHYCPPACVPQPGWSPTTSLPNHLTFYSHHPRSPSSTFSHPINCMKKECSPVQMLSCTPYAGYNAPRVPTEWHEPTRQSPVDMAIRAPFARHIGNRPTYTSR